MTDWAILVLVCGACIAAALCCAIFIAETTVGSIIAFALMLATGFGMYQTVLHGEPDKPSPTRGYVVGIQLYPAHTEQECSGGKVIVCRDIHIGTRYSVKIAALNGDVGWRDVIAPVFAECDIDSFFERGRCTEADAR